MGQAHAVMPPRKRHVSVESSLSENLPPFTKGGNYLILLNRGNLCFQRMVIKYE